MKALFQVLMMAPIAAVLIKCVTGRPNRSTKRSRATSQAERVRRRSFGANDDRTMDFVNGLVGSR